MEYFRDIENENIIYSVGGKIYKCNNCNSNLFSDINILPDDCKLPEIDALSLKNLLLPISPCSESCPFNEYYFIEPMKWMVSEELLTAAHTTENSLNCPECKSKIGTYCWKGFGRCDHKFCFAGIGPSFRISKNEVHTD